MCSRAGVLRSISHHIRYQAMHGVEQFQLVLFVAAIRAAFIHWPCQQIEKSPLIGVQRANYHIICVEFMAHHPPKIAIYDT